MLWLRTLGASMLFILRHSLSGEGCWGVVAAAAATEMWGGESRGRLYAGAERAGAGTAHAAGGLGLRARPPPSAQNTGSRFLFDVVKPWWTLGHPRCVRHTVTLTG